MYTSQKEGIFLSEGIFCENVAVILTQDRETRTDLETQTKYLV